jgi:hypothetical protein
VAHVAKAHVALLLRFIRGPLSVQNAVCDVFDRHEANALGILAVLELDRVEEVKCQCPVVASVEGPIEHLLDNIIYDVVQEVVPRETEEEVLGRGEHKRSAVTY